MEIQDFCRTSNTHLKASLASCDTIHDMSRWLVTFPTLLHVDIALLFQYTISVLEKDDRKTAWVVMHKDDYVSNHILTGAFFSGVSESVKDRISLIICATLEELSTFVSNEWGQRPDILVFINVASLFQDVLMTELSDTIASMLALVSLKAGGKIERIFVSVPGDWCAPPRALLEARSAVTLVVKMSGLVGKRCVYFQHLTGSLRVGLGCWAYRSRLNTESLRR